MYIFLECFQHDIVGETRIVPHVLGAGCMARRFDLLQPQSNAKHCQLMTDSRNSMTLTMIGRIMPATTVLLKRPRWGPQWARLKLQHATHVSLWPRAEPAGISWSFLSGLGWDLLRGNYHKNEVSLHPFPELLLVCCSLSINSLPSLSETWLLP